MTIAVVQSPDLRLEIDLKPLSELTEENFVALCAANPELRLERTAQGEILIMPPEGGGSAYRNQSIGAQLYLWAKRDGCGVSFGPAAGFRLPNGATRSPDASWVRIDRLTALAPEDKERFLPLCPDFVVELRSPTDRLGDLEAKMSEYIASGAALGWLIDPQSRTVSVYRPGRPVERIDEPATLSGEPELPGFVLDLGEVWVLGY